MGTAVTNHRLHSGCIACGRNNQYGLKLRFFRQEDGSVTGASFCRKELAGYDGLLHGGVAAMMLDSAMSNCLFAAGVTALTAEMSVKYRAPVKLGRAVSLKAWIASDLDPLYIVKSELAQDGGLKVSAEAKFMRSEEIK